MNDIWEVPVNGRWFVAKECGLWPVGVGVGVKGLVSLDASLVRIIIPSIQLVNGFYGPHNS